MTDAVVDLLAETATPGHDLPVVEASAGTGLVDRPEQGHPPGATPSEQAPDSEEHGPLVWVRVLGPVEVDWRKPATRPQLTELVAVIATHPPQVGADRVKLALCPVDPDDERFGERSPNTLWALVSKARRERLWAQLMLALYRAGRQAEALRAFQAARRVLSEELGLAPSPPLSALEGAILRQEPDLDWVPPAPAGRDRESHRHVRPLPGRSAAG